MYSVGGSYLYNVNIHFVVDENTYFCEGMGTILGSSKNSEMSTETEKCILERHVEDCKTKYFKVIYCLCNFFVLALLWIYILIQSLITWSHFFFLLDPCNLPCIKQNACLTRSYTIIFSIIFFFSFSLSISLSFFLSFLVYITQYLVHALP